MLAAASWFKVYLCNNMMSSYVVHNSDGASLGMHRHISIIPNHFSQSPEPTLSWHLDVALSPSHVVPLDWSMTLLLEEGWCADLPRPGMKHRPTLQWIFQSMTQLNGQTIPDTTSKADKDLVRVCTDRLDLIYEGYIEYWGNDGHIFGKLGQQSSMQGGAPVC